MNYFTSVKFQTNIIGSADNDFYSKINYYLEFDDAGHLISDSYCSQVNIINDVNDSSKPFVHQNIAKIPFERLQNKALDQIRNN